jgi:hypothetical protein
MSIKRPLQVALLLAIGIPAAHAKEPYSLIGSGTMKCGLFVSAERDPVAKNIVGSQAFAWVQGYFSARNTPQPDVYLTVSGTLSAQTLESMLIDQCNEMPKETPLYLAADSLYEKLKQKSM